MVEGRNAKQCRARWLEVITHKRSRTGWTEDELQELKWLVELKGRRWADISSLMPGRTPQDVKNKYNVLLLGVPKQVSDRSKRKGRTKKKPPRRPSVRFEFGAERILFSYNTFFP